MNEKDLKSLWQSASTTLETNIELTRRNTDDITRMKAQNFLSSVKPSKIFALIAGFLWLVSLCYIIANLFIYAYDKTSLFFLYSATIQALLTIITIAVYIYQLTLIDSIDFSEPVLAIQEKIAKLKISTLRVARLIFLQLPLWTTFYLSENIFKNGNIILLIVQGIITVSFAFIAIWLFINIRFENRNKRWFKWIFGGKEWQPLLRSMELLDQIKEYREQK